MKKIIYGKISLNQDNIIYVNEKNFVGSQYHYKNNEIILNEKKRIEKQFLLEKSFPELFAYEDISMWWFFHEVFFYRLKNNLNFITTFLELIEQVQPNLIKIENDYSMLDLIQQISNKKNIPLEYSKFQYLKFKIKDDLKRYVRKHLRGYRLQKKLIHRIKTNIKQYYSKYHSPPNINNKIVFASPITYRRYIYNLEKETSEKGEYLVQAIMDLIKNKSDVIGMSVAHAVPEHTDDVLSGRLESDTPWFPEEIFLSNHYKFDEHKKFIKKYKKLISTKEFQNLFEFNGISYWKQIESVFIQMTYAPYLSYWLNMIDSFVLVFTANKPRAIFLTSEIDAPGLAIIVAAKKHKIKTIGIQQGMIYDQGPPAYLHDEYALLKPYDYPFPDILLVFGEFTKQVLIRNGHPPEKLITFGNPVYFNLDDIEKTLHTKSLSEKYKIDINQKVILFTTTQWQEAYGYSGNDYDTQIWRYLLENFKSEKDFLIILKPHPLENTAAYENILKKYSISNARIIQGNLIEMLCISLVVVSNFSTVVMDAICLKKPVIEVKWDDVDDRYMRFDEFGVTMPSKLDQLSKNIHEIMNNVEIRNTLLENRVKFIKEHYNLPIQKITLEKILKKIIEEE